MIFRKKKISVVLVLFLAFLINIIPLYIYFVILYNDGVAQIEKSVYNTVHAETSFFLTDLEHQIESLRAKQNELLIFKDVRWLSDLNDNSTTQYEKILLKNNVFGRLQSLSYGSYVDDAHLYILNTNTVISVKSGISKMTNADVDQLIPYFNGSMEYINNNINIIDIKDGVVNLIVYNMPYSNQKIKIPKLVSIVELSNEKLSGTLKRYTKGNLDNNMVFTSNDDSIIASTLSSDIESQMQHILQQDHTNINGSYFKYTLDNRVYLIFKAISSNGKWKLYDIIPQDTLFRPVEYYIKWMLTSLALVFATLLSFLTFSYRIFYKPIHTLIKSFKQLQDGNMFGINEKTISKELQTIFDSFNEMIYNLKSHINQEYRQRILVQDAELKQLQLQINPHFLYNSFFLLESMMQEEEYDKATQMARLMGVYMKYITNTSVMEVFLFEEVMHARAYADIIQMRFPSRIHLDFDNLPQSMERISVPKLVLQPLIENAFQHGLKDIDEGIIKVNFDYDSDSIYICVEDNGEEINEEKLDYIRNILRHPEMNLSSVVALYNIQRRINLMFGDDSGLYVDQSVLGGLRVTIRMRLLNNIKGIESDDVQIIDR